MRKLNTACTILVGLLASTSHNAVAQQVCDGALSQLRTIDGNVVNAFGNGAPAVYFRANMDVNTDGTSRSYHPDDPHGRALALNNVANAITSRTDKNGKPVSCSPRKGACYSEYVSAFEAARDSGWATVGVPQVKTDGIVPWKLNARTGRLEPCRIEGGPFNGYFVSQTSAILNPRLGECQQERYVDALTIRAIVLPKKHGFSSQGVKVDSTDAVIVRDRKTGQFQFALVGDSGPKDKIGEGSIALTAALAGQTLTGNEVYPQIKKLARSDVDYLILPRTDVVRLSIRQVDNAEIDRVVGTAFSDWGGISRFEACFGKVLP